MNFLEHKVLVAGFLSLFGSPENLIFFPGNSTAILVG